MAQQFQEALIRKRAVLEMTGWSNSTLYNRIATGQFKPGVKVGPRMVACHSVTTEIMHSA